MSEEFHETVSVPELRERQSVTGTVTLVDDKKVSVDIGHKFEGIIPIRELSVLHIEHPAQVAAVGDEVEAVVVKIDEEAGIVVLSKREAVANGAWERLQEWYDQGKEFDVVIHDVVKGGLVSDVGVRAFMPASLVDFQFVQDLNEFKGKTVRVRIVEIDAENNKLILSRRAVLEGERRQQESVVLDSLRPGQLLEGTVARLTTFGAFVDIGGIDGLVHISEIAWHHVDHPSDVMHEGDRVRVKILRLDPSIGKISLSIKEAMPSPWETAMGDIHPGQILTGTVRRLTDFGAFVEVRPGLEGLVHVSQIANQHIAKPSDVLEEGQQVQVKVLAVEPERRRISLSVKEALAGKERERTRNDVQKFMEKNDSAGTGATLGDLFGDLFKR